MSVLIEHNQRRYVGLAGDLKPTDGVAPGSSFFESDTLALYVFDGSQWVNKGARESREEIYLQQILEQLVEQNQLLLTLLTKL